MRKKLAPPIAKPRVNPPGFRENKECPHCKYVEDDYPSNYQTKYHCKKYDMETWKRHVCDDFESY